MNATDAFVALVRNNSNIIIIEIYWKQSNVENWNHIRHHRLLNLICILFSVKYKTLKRDILSLRIFPYTSHIHCYIYITFSKHMYEGLWPTGHQRMNASLKSVILHTKNYVWGHCLHLRKLKRAILLGRVYNSPRRLQSHLTNCCLATLNSQIITVYTRGPFC